MVVIGVGGGNFAHKQSVRLERVASETHDALCSFKLDLKRRYSNGQGYVADVREGRRPIIQGITLADLERSLSNQRSTLDSLKPLDCS